MKKIHLVKYLKEHCYCKVCSFQFDSVSIYELHVKLVHDNIANGPTMMGNNSANKQEDSKTEINNENCYEINNGEIFQSYPWIENDAVQDEIVYGQIIETYNKLMLEKK